jgi:hypothetical protein
LRDAMNTREWPPGHTLYSEGGLHLSFDPPSGPGILMRVDELRDVVTVLRVEVFRSEADALAWFAEQRKKYAN